MAHVLDLKGLRELVMAMAIFDTLKFSKRLKEAGVPSAQADAEAEGLSEIFTVNLQKLVTKEDLQLAKKELQHQIIDVSKELRHEINDLGKDLGHEINDLSKDLRHEIKDVRKDITNLEQRFDTKLEKFEMSLLVKMGIMLASAAGLVVSATVTLMKVL
ncbi:Hypothetical phage protein [Mycoavidus cysteinexigens]|uniref:Hypothetical phage protein n=1 Tax=Mycoavidus cysteinexigens TaxID=1553431 RepID=A0A2Z6ETT0_9BURK|nr:hypothetical protein [Mycoavidus cysteinexigens]BBE08788.1 Hypothetical phage protein [Mycoavidus cysteinexigens]GLR01610.1 hypothetical protein GCM10007934_14220 [Mycoavidus cysteinexigens]